MSKLMSLKNLDDLDNLLQSAGEKKVLLFKRSATCPISKAAETEYLNFLQENNNDRVVTAVVTVQEARVVADEIARRYNIKHESPQLLLVQGNQVKFHCSHYSITCDKIKEVIANTD